MKKASAFLLLIFMLNACSYSANEVAKESISPINTQNFDSNIELTETQESAFSAMNTLQVSTDEMNRLYSTFAGIYQECYPPDTSLIISQSELLIALNQFVNTNCTALTTEERNKLVTAAVLAQEQYNLSLCMANFSTADFSSGIPRSGTWILPNVLGLRDVIIDW